MPEANIADSSELTGPVTSDELPTLKVVPLPNGARVAVTIQLTLEGTEKPPTSGGPLGSALSAEAIAKGVPDWAAVSDARYGPLTGIPRLLETMAKYDAPAAVTTSGIIAERYPDLLVDIVGRGHEIIGHAFSQDRPMSALDEDDDHEVIVRCCEAFEKACGYRPVGWASQGSRRGNYTVLNLLREGFIYTNDFREADIPFVVAQLGSKKLLAMPRTDQINDMFCVSRHGNAPETYVMFFKRAFDQLYEEGGDGGRVVTAIVHGHLFGRPWGAAALGECLEYAKSRQDVWITTRRFVAEHYLSGL